MKSNVEFANILSASQQIDPVFLNTPIATDAALDSAAGCQLLAKVEVANPIGSFKIGRAHV